MYSCADCFKQNKVFVGTREEVAMHVPSVHGRLARFLEEVIE